MADPVSYRSLEISGAHITFPRYSEHIVRGLGAQVRVGTHTMQQGTVALRADVGIFLRSI